MIVEPDHVTTFAATNRMNNTPGNPVAVLLHLATTRHLGEFVEALKRIHPPHDVIVNLPRDGGCHGAGDGRRETVNAAFAGATIIESDNRGMDVGGMLRLFGRALGGEYRFALYLHSKSDDAWRRSMLDSVTRHAGRAIDMMSHVGRTARHNPIGMAGAYSYPFDYYNIGPFLDLMADLGVNLSTTWDRYYARYPAARSMPLAQRIAHSLDSKRHALRPEVDVEYATALLGDIHAPAQPMTPATLSRMIADRVVGALPYFPGNFFWIRMDVMRALARAIDLQREYQSLPHSLQSDRHRQSRAHAWERALPVFAVKRGYALASLGTD